MILRITPFRVDSDYKVTKGKTYICKFVEGIFQDKPFVRFVTDNKKVAHAHLSRFKILTKCKYCNDELVQNLFTGAIQCNKCGKELKNVL